MLGAHHVRSPSLLKQNLRCRSPTQVSEVVKQFWWSALGIEESFMHHFEDLQPYFDGKFLWVSHVYHDRLDDCMEILENHVLAMLQLQGPD